MDREKSHLNSDAVPVGGEELDTEATNATSEERVIDSHNIRPRRTRRKPGWMKDFIVSWKTIWESDNVILVTI